MFKGSSGAFTSALCSGSGFAVHLWSFCLAVFCWFFLCFLAAVNSFMVLSSSLCRNVSSRDLKESLMLFIQCLPSSFCALKINGFFQWISNFSRARSFHANAQITRINTENCLWRSFDAWNLPKLHPLTSETPKFRPPDDFIHRGGCQELHRRRNMSRNVDLRIFLFLKSLLVEPRHKTSQKKLCKTPTAQSARNTRDPPCLVQPQIKGSPNLSVFWGTETLMKTCG